MATRPQGSVGTAAARTTGTGANVTRSFTRAERAIILGVACDLHTLRTRSELTVREVASGVRWSSHNEVARYEHGAPNNKKDKDPNVRMISVRRYFELLKFYFSVLPESAKADHPAGALTDKGYSLAVDRLSNDTNMTIYEFVVFVQAMCQVGSITDSDPHMKLADYLQIRGTPARGT
jgi:hypothetical protein